MNIVAQLCSSPPVFLHTSAQSDLLSHLCADGVGEDDLGQIGLHGADASACGQRADVHHQHLVLRQLLDLQRHEQREEAVRTTFQHNQNILNLSFNAYTITS